MPVASLRFPVYPQLLSDLTTNGRFRDLPLVGFSYLLQQLTELKGDLYFILLVY